MPEWNDRDLELLKEEFANRDKMRRAEDKLKKVSSWQETNARQKESIDRLVEKFIAIRRLAWSADLTGSRLKLEAAITAIREELEK